MASGAEVAALEAMELVPLTWDVFTEIMVALGIGTAAYWGSKPESFRKDTIDDFIEQNLPEVNWLYQDMADFGQKDVPQYLDGFGAWLKVNVARMEDSLDWIHTLPVSVAGKFVEFANDMEWLTDQSVTSEELDSNYRITSFDNVELLSKQDLLTIVSTATNLGNNRKTALAGWIQNNMPANGGWVFSTNETQVGTFTWLCIPLQVLKDNYTINSSRIISGGLNVEYIPNPGFNDTFRSQYQHYIIGNSSTIGDGLASNGYGRQGSIYQQLSFSLADTNGMHISNIGTLVGGAITDVPVGENGQATIDEDTGAIDLPYGVGDYLNVPNVGNSVPIGLPESIGSDVIYVNPGIADTPEVVPLPNVWDLPGSITNDLPADTTQDIAQDGTFDRSKVDDKEVPENSSTRPTDNAFMVPEWIKNRFPFCIPFDLKAAAQKFSSAGTSAPSFTFNLKFAIDGNQDHKITVDLSRFDSIMQVFRLGELIVFLIGLAILTRSIIRG